MNGMIAPSKARCKFVVQNDIYDNDMTHLIDALAKEGCDYQTMPYVHYGLGDPIFNFSESECVTFLCSISFAKYVQRKTAFVPGPIVTWKNYDCLTYYKYFRPYLTNSDNLILPLSEVIRARDHIYWKFGTDKGVFIRPNGGSKAFNGQTLRYDRLMTADLCGDMDALVSVSKPKDIVNEYRFFIADNEIVCETSYRIMRAHKTDAEIPEFVVDFVNDVLKSVDWRPDPMFVMDVGVDNLFKPSIIELNSVACSGLYNADPKPLIKKLAEVALQIYREYNDIDTPALVSV
jgi:hypothetical protein